MKKMMRLGDCGCTKDGRPFCKTRVGVRFKKGTCRPGTGTYRRKKRRKTTKRRRRSRSY